jgi:hypothetical protein
MMNEKIAKAIENFCLNCVRSLRCKLVRLTNVSNIAKAISSEIQAMSARVDVLNQASLDAIMK